MKIKLFPKFLIFIILISVLPLIVIGFLTIDINKKMLQTLMLEYHIKITTALSEKIDDKITDIDSKMSFIIATQRQEYSSVFEQIGILRNILIASDNFVRASIIDKTGDEIVASNPKFEKSPPQPKNYSNNIYYIQVRKSEKYQIAPLYYENERPLMDFYFPLANKYVLKICVSFDSISDVIEESRIGATGYILIIDETGRILFHSDKKYAIDSENIYNEPIAKEAIKRQGVGSQEFISKDGLEMIGTFAPVKKLRWNVIFQQTKAEAYSPMIKMRRNAIISIMVVFLLAIFIAYVLANSLSKPILKVIDVSKNVARRDFTQKVNIKTRDEMYELANNFNNMIEELSHYTKMQADKLSAIVYSINDGLILTDENNNIVIMNNMAAKILGVSKDLTNSLFETVKNDKLLTALKEVYERPEISREVDLSTDKPFIISVSTQLITDSERKKIEGIIFILRDITGKKEVDKMKDDFFHGVTHDLRNPLTSVLGFLRFLLNESVGPINEKQKYFLEIISTSSNRLLAMINNILDIAKLEVGKMELSLTQFDLKNTAERVCSSMISKAVEGNIELVNSVTSMTISADEGLIERALINLVGNALKYTPSSGKVTITAVEKNENVEISVNDTGEGIPAEYLNKIFDKFQQVKGRSHGGTGIGLTITKYIVESHLGKIWVESELNKGSKFMIAIPKNLKKNEKDEIYV
ncbi:MAG: ATP-binding protein [Elusimicrobia bacterium]|nr:ATP-binding protein [Elusimicrobiota bacterium]